MPALTPPLAMAIRASLGATARLERTKAARPPSAQTEACVAMHYDASTFGAFGVSFSLHLLVHHSCCCVRVLSVHRVQVRLLSRCYKPHIDIMQTAQNLRCRILCQQVADNIDRQGMHALRRKAREMPVAAAQTLCHSLGDADRPVCTFSGASSRRRLRLQAEAVRRGKPAAWERDMCQPAVGRKMWYVRRRGSDRALPRTV